MFSPLNGPVLLTVGFFPGLFRCECASDIDNAVRNPRNWSQIKGTYSFLALPLVSSSIDYFLRTIFASHASKSVSHLGSVRVNLSRCHWTGSTLLRLMKRNSSSSDSSKGKKKACTGGGRSSMASTEVDLKSSCEVLPSPTQSETDKREYRWAENGADSLTPDLWSMITGGKAAFFYFCACLRMNRTVKQLNRHFC